MRYEEEVVSKFGEGKVLNGCAYGLQHKKQYRYWTLITQDIWTPHHQKIYCKACKDNTRHEQVMCAKKGNNRPPPLILGYLMKAAKNRIPTELAQEIGEAFMKLSRR